MKVCPSQAEGDAWLYEYATAVLAYSSSSRTRGPSLFCKYYARCLGLVLKNACIDSATTSGASKGILCPTFFTRFLSPVIPKSPERYWESRLVNAQLPQMPRVSVKKHFNRFSHNLWCFQRHHVPYVLHALPFTRHSQIA